MKKKLFFGLVVFCFYTQATHLFRSMEREDSPLGYSKNESNLSKSPLPRKPDPNDFLYESEYDSLSARSANTSLGNIGDSDVVMSSASQETHLIVESEIEAADPDFVQKVRAMISNFKKSKETVQITKFAGKLRCDIYNTERTVCYISHSKRQQKNLLNFLGNLLESSNSQKRIRE